MTKREPRLCVYTRSWRTSGAGLFAQELVEGLVNAGADVTFVCPAIDNPALDAPRPGLRRLRPPREKVGHASALERMLFSIARITLGLAALFVARLRARTFIISIPDPLVAFLPALVLLKLTGARVVFVAHDPLPHAWRTSERWRPLERATHHACYWLSTAVVVLSDPTRERMHALFPTLRVPVAVIEHGVFLLPGVPPLPGNGKLLCFGTLRRNKGIVEGMAGVIAAHAAGVPLTLIVAGEEHREDQGYADECAALARQAPDVIDWRPGYVADDTLAALLGEADALLLPYKAFFSQSGVAILAAANARPVIGSDAGGLGMLFAEGMAGTMVVPDIATDSVAAAVTAFASIPAATWRARADAYRTVMLDRRSWDAIARRYLDLVAKLD